MLKKHGAAVAVSITSGVATSAVSIFLMCRVLGLSHAHYVTLLPKSITTAIGMGVSEEAGGIVTLTVISIIITGVLGNMVGETVLKLAKIHHPVAKGLAFGTSAHAVGTAKAAGIRRSRRRYEQPFYCSGRPSHCSCSTDRI